MKRAQCEYLRRRNIPMVWKELPETGKMLKSHEMVPPKKNAQKNYGMKFLKIIFLLFAGFACTEEPVETVFFDLDTEAGLFICCEGNFMYGNGSLAFYNPQTRKVTNRLFYARNNVPPGDVVQSLAAAGDLLYLV